MAWRAWEGRPWHNHMFLRPERVRLDTCALPSSLTRPTAHSDDPSRFKLVKCDCRRRNSFRAVPPRNSLPSAQLHDDGLPSRHPALRAKPTLYLCDALVAMMCRPFENGGRACQCDIATVSETKRGIQIMVSDNSSVPSFLRHMPPIKFEATGFRSQRRRLAQCSSELGPRNIQQQLWRKDYDPPNLELNLWRELGSLTVAEAQSVGTM